MSGIKDSHATMRRDERDRQKAKAKRRKAERDEALYREQLTLNALNASNRQNETLIHALNNEISGLHVGMRNLRNEQNKRFLEQAKAMDDLKVDLESQIEKNRKSLQNDIDKVKADIEATLDSHRKQADFWISQTEIFFKDIEQFRHELFTPTRLQKLKAALAQASLNMKSEAFQAAISSAQTVFNDAVELKEIVVNAQMEWNFYFKKLQEALADTKSNLNSSKKMKYTFTTEEGEETVDADVNYWTDKALDRIEEKLAQIERRAAKPGEISTDGLKEMTADIKRLNEEMETAESKAKEALISSLLREDMAAEIVKIMIAKGWTLVSNSYEGGEYNGKYRVKLTDIKGNEFAAVISSKDDMTSVLEMHTKSVDNDEGFRRKQAEDIQKSLRENDGLNISEPVARKGYEHKNSDSPAIMDTQATEEKMAQTAVK